MTSKYEVNTFDATGVCKKKLNITHKTESQTNNSQQSGRVHFINP